MSIRPITHSLLNPQIVSCSLKFEADTELAEALTVSVCALCLVLVGDD